MRMGEVVFSLKLGESNNIFPFQWGHTREQ